MCCHVLSIQSSRHILSFKPSQGHPGILRGHCSISGQLLDLSCPFATNGQHLEKKTKQNVWRCKERPTVLGTARYKYSIARVLLSALAYVADGPSSRCSSQWVALDICFVQACWVLISPSTAKLSNLIKNDQLYSTSPQSSLAEARAVPQHLHQTWQIPRRTSSV